MSNDVHADQDASSWTLRFGDPVVTQLRVDYSFSLLLGGGALVVLAEPFDLRRGALTIRVPPGEAVFEVADALSLFNSRIDEVRAGTSGELRIDFGDDLVATVPVNLHYENWQIVMPDGEQWIGTPGGGRSPHRRSLTTAALSEPLEHDLDPALGGRVAPSTCARAKA